MAGRVLAVTAMVQLHGGTKAFLYTLQIDSCRIDVFVQTLDSEFFKKPLY